MVTFLSVFLGLVAGPQTVELAVGDEVAAVELLLLAAGGEPPRTVHLIWRSVDGSRPDAAVITFDGRPLEVGDRDRVDLPAYD